MNYSELKDYILSDKFCETLYQIKGTRDLALEKRRYLALLDKAYERFNDGDYHLISSPGRTEIGGNHTDHQHGHTLSATINFDNICVVKAIDKDICTFVDEKFPDCIISLNNLEKKQEECNTSTSLIKGIAYKLNELGYRTGGFEAICDSGVAIGSGMSSSACFEIMIVEIFNSLYNKGVITPIDRAIISQFAENDYFGKASGLLDQATISCGGLVAMDFKDPKAPTVESYDFNFEDYGYKLMLVDCKGDHADLSDEYSAIPKEMKMVANVMDGDVLADCDPGYFFSHVKEIRESLENDRAVLRAFHLFTEDKRAVDEKEAVKNKDIDTLLKLIKESGQSSFMYNQNISVGSLPKTQPMAIALAMSSYILGDRGAYRVHGGGFGGTILAVVPFDLVDSYKLVLGSVFGKDSILNLTTSRSFGTKTLI